MKKYLSVFYLTARESIYKISLLWLISGILQSVSLAVFLVTQPTLPKVSLFSEKAYLPVFFSVTLVLTAVLLAKTGMQFNSKTGYTLRRLLVSEKAVFVLQTVYNFMMLFILLLFEVLLIFLLLTAGKNALSEEFISVQTEYKAFYGDLFIHNLFAGRDVLRIARNILTLFSLGINLSAFSFLFRRNQKWLGAVIMIAVAVIVFVSKPSISSFESDIFLLTPSVMFICMAAVTVLIKEGQYDA